MNFLKSILLSYSQILFSNRVWFGAIALLSTFIYPQLGAAGLVGVILTNTIAYILKYDKKTIESGYFGFNGILLGIAIAFYIKLSLFTFFISLIFIAILFFVNIIVEDQFRVHLKLPVMSIPFVVTFFFFALFISNFTGIQFLPTSLIDQHNFNWLPIFFKRYFNSVGMILFIPSISAGIILTIALIIFSRVSFLLSLISFTTSFFLAKYLLPQFAESHSILIGLNSILCAIALGGSLIIPSRKSFILTILVQPIVIVIIGIVLNIFEGTRFPVLVLPFNVAVLSILFMIKLREGVTKLIPIYFLPGSPEENFFYHYNTTNRFKKFRYLFAELPFFGKWKVSQGVNGTFTHKNQWRNALDFVVCDDDGKEFSGSGNYLSDYYCYRLPVVASIDGVVVKVIDSIPNNPVGKINVEQNWGNTIIINHGAGLFSSLSHLEPNSAKVKLGDYVRKGDSIALCGNSGRSQYPHLHFQFQLSDKVGEQTFDFPLSSFVEIAQTNNFNAEVKSFSLPIEKSCVQNIETDINLNRAFDFQVGNKFVVKGKYKNRSFTENWSVKIDSINTITLVNEANDSITIYPTPRINYFTHYNGSKHSALYSFYLSALNIPYFYQKNLVWNDTLPLSKIPASIIYKFADLFLFFGAVIDVFCKFSFDQMSEDSFSYKINNKISIYGNHIFSWYKDEFNSTLSVSKNGSIEGWRVLNKNNIIFNCQIVERTIL